MTFQFFTLGGKQFWEDVFYYQKWRIQRHYRTKKYRLLDSFDIRRASGTFEECRQAFLKFIEMYEIPRQKGPLVVLVHGLSQSKDIFKPLSLALQKEGFNVAAINYPSTKKSMKAHASGLAFLLSHLEDADNIILITKGTGAILLRYLLKERSLLENKFQVEKIIEINPTNLGSDICTILSRYKIFNFIFGPALKECSVGNVRLLEKLPIGIPVGLIFCETYRDKILKPIIKRYEGIHIPGDLQNKDFGTASTYVANKRLNIFKNKELIEKCVRFLKKNEF